MKLTLPEGFMPPKSARPDEPFEVVATIRPDEDGQFSLVALDGMALPENEEDEMSEPANERTDATNIKLPFGEDDEEY